MGQSHISPLHHLEPCGFCLKFPWDGFCWGQVRGHKSHILEPSHIVSDPRSMVTVLGWLDTFLWAIWCRYMLAVWGPLFSDLNLTLQYILIPSLPLQLFPKHSNEFQQLWKFSLETLPPENAFTDFPNNSFAGSHSLIKSLFGIWKFNLLTPGARGGIFATKI